ncbi:MAG: hypothetical protein IJ809_03500 [Clostridia bacterium]|nr:hypothetical protein [Clostridia bacterium]
MKKDKNQDTKNYTIEELAQFIHTSPDMKKGPKQPMSLFTKIVIVVILLSIVIFVYFRYIYKPYVYTLEFSPEIYRIDDYSVITKSSGEVVIGIHELKLDYKVVNVLKYVDYTNTSKKYAMFLSEFGNLYLYDEAKNELNEYYIGDLKVKEINTRNLDNIEVIEATFENGVKRIVYNNTIYDKSVDEVKMMDEIVYTNDDIYVYKYNQKLYMCRYNEVAHYDLASNSFISSNKLIKTFVDDNNVELLIRDVVVKNANSNIYVYVITEDGRLGFYSFEEGKFDYTLNYIELNYLKLNTPIDKFVDSELKYGARIKIKDEDNRFVDVFEDKLIYGSLSSDLSLIAYVTDFSKVINYIITSSEEGNNKYEKGYYVIENVNSEKNIESLEIVFLNMHGELLLLRFNILDGDEVTYETRKIEMKENEKVDKIYLDNGELYITIEKEIRSNYVVFENTVEYEYESYLLKEYIKGVD